MNKELQDAIDWLRRLAEYAQTTHDSAAMRDEIDFWEREIRKALRPIDVESEGLVDWSDVLFWLEHTEGFGSLDEVHNLIWLVKGHLNAQGRITPVEPIDTVKTVTLRNEGDYTLVVEINDEVVFKEHFENGGSEINHTWHRGKSCRAMTGAKE